MICSCVVWQLKGQIEIISGEIEWNCTLLLIDRCVVKLQSCTIQSMVMWETKWKSQQCTKIHHTQTCALDKKISKLCCEYIVNTVFLALFPFQFQRTIDSFPRETLQGLLRNYPTISKGPYSMYNVRLFPKH